ncbi:MAG: regulator of amino acid metabolism, contains ACT domain protein [Candidatus Methanoplasma sp.]|jgi:predicted regulator of amino acid metabolism with ACT domain|nr:regulator of amino acid metabolism, contains ACT domain protein [Candidatus Methanoplasma sp.]
MDRVFRSFKGLPSQERVAAMMVRHGLRVEGGSVYCGDIEQSDAAMARAAGVDRRVVRSTIERIEADPELRGVFSRLRSTLLMSDVAPLLGCTSLEIVPTDARMPGILACITDLIYRKGLTVRQAVVDDPGDREESHLMVVVDGEIPAEILPAIRDCKGVASVMLR